MSWSVVRVPSNDGYPANFDANPPNNDGYANFEAHAVSYLLSNTVNYCEPSTGNEEKNLNKTNEKTNNFTCSVCGRTFKYNSQFVIHSRIHSNERPYICRLCNKGFYTQGMLNKHNIFHSEERPFQCDECKSSFKTKKCLETHALIHSGEKPFKCVECGQGFRQKGSFNYHQRLHSNIKPCICSYCGKRFRRQEGLRIHMVARHTHEKRFECEICHEKFKYRESMKNHVKKHKEDSSDKSPICEDLNTNSTLKDHSKGISLLSKHQTVKQDSQINLQQDVELQDKSFSLVLRKEPVHEIRAECEALGKIVASKLRKMNDTQKLIADKLINDILYKGLMNDINKSMFVKNK